MSYIVIIPARLKSSRLPNKAIADIHGKPMVQLTWENAMKSDAKRVIIATEDRKVFDACKSFGANVVMTSDKHESGIERISEVIKIEEIPDKEIIVNLQGDEPLLKPELIDQVARQLHKSVAPMSTLSERISMKEALNPNNVKVSFDKTGRAINFSRAPIPWARSEFSCDCLSEGFTPPIDSEIEYFKHIGLYAYRAGFIDEYIQMEKSPLEAIESLEQLRVIWNGYPILVEEALFSAGVGVDTQSDLDAVRQLLSA